MISYASDVILTTIGDDIKYTPTPKENIHNKHVCVVICCEIFYSFGIMNCMSLCFVYALGDVSGLAYFNTIDEHLQYNRGCCFPHARYVSCWSFSSPITFICNGCILHVSIYLITLFFVIVHISIKTCFGIYFCNTHPLFVRSITSTFKMFILKVIVAFLLHLVALWLFLMFSFVFLT